MNAELREAYERCRQGFAADRVVADPEINSRFILECRQLGLSEPAVDLNRCLLNLRKRGLLRPKERSKATSFDDEDEYRFASEIAVRFLERRDCVSLDDIICDPEKACEFDDIAARIAPGFSSLQYRWAAFNLRKRRRLRPEIISHALPSKSVTISAISQISASQVPDEAGLYIFLTKSQTLYVGEAANLRIRIKKHLDHSDNKHLARWFWEYGGDDVFLELHVLSEKVSSRVRRALEAELITSRHPIFNVAGTEP